MLEIVPMTLKEANAFVEQNHRHHGKVVGHKFSIGLSDGEKIVGVAIVGRPVARHLDDGWTLEVNRLCTDGTRNACSMLYAASWRAARAMGYKRIVTYILDSENGASLRASGWKCVGQAGELRWTGRRRPEVDLYPAQMKIRYENDNIFVFDIIFVIKKKCFFFNPVCIELNSNHFSFCIDSNLLCSY